MHKKDQGPRSVLASQSLILQFTLPSFRLSQPAPKSRSSIRPGSRWAGYTFRCCSFPQACIPCNSAAIRSRSLRSHPAAIWAMRPCMGKQPMFLRELPLFHNLQDLIPWQIVVCDQIIKLPSESMQIPYIPQTILSSPLSLCSSQNLGILAYAVSVLNLLDLPMTVNCANDPVLTFYHPQFNLILIGANDFRLAPFSFAADGEMPWNLVKARVKLSGES